MFNKITLKKIEKKNLERWKEYSHFTLYLLANSHPHSLSVAFPANLSWTIRSHASAYDAVGRCVVSFSLEITQNVAETLMLPWWKVHDVG